MQTWLNLQDKIIIVTGGASGIGLAIVEELLAQGANVQMVDIHGGDGQYEGHKGYQWICPYISRHLLSLNPLLACCRRYSRG
ncbi:SDR family NAD(P)-dependent oxidoreductase, partial [Escherichia coli]|nr:SDR family NAD(P)-dependent oxidoreductase [Escherichia coli]